MDSKGNLKKYYDNDISGTSETLYRHEKGLDNFTDVVTRNFDPTSVMSQQDRFLINSAPQKFRKGNNAKKKKRRKRK